MEITDEILAELISWSYRSGIAHPDIPFPLAI
jgi:hypothetical protein